MNSKKNYLVAALIIAAIVALGAYVLASRKGNDGMGAQQAENTNATTTPEGTTIVVGGGAQVPAPSLARPIPKSAPADLDAAAYPSAVAFLQKAIDALKKDSRSYQDWINLGLGRQMLGDYEGARLAWEYAITLDPGHPIAYGNLGYLTMIYLKDYPKSEAYYKKAITLGPSNTSFYHSLLELYTYHYKQGTGEGEALLKAGIAANPQAYDLGVLLARLYREAGKTTEAKAAYSAAAAMAQAAGKADVAAAITAEGKEL